MQDEIQITVIATGFDKDSMTNMVNAPTTVASQGPKNWEKKISSIPSNKENTSSQPDLDIPAFLRKNKNKGI